MKKTFYLLSIIYLITSCSSFSKLSKETKFGKERGYQSVFNQAINFKSLTFGDFKFALRYREYKKLRSNNTEFKNILFYGKTDEPAYEYFVLLNPKEKKFDTSRFFVKDTIIKNNNFILLISNDAPKSDIKFISENIFEY
ncbi:hypothetical protein JSO59_010585 [Riemerella anatipestifer]|uniref:hypothetical protein n=1 Tax=Riemerella anatipestifer TaxID=34085 RepID=UPI0030C39437